MKSPLYMIMEISLVKRVERDKGDLLSQESVCLRFFNLIQQLAVSFWAETSRLYTVLEFMTNKYCMQDRNSFSIDMRKDHMY